MSELCGLCRHQRAADSSAFDDLKKTGVPPSLQVAINRRLSELVTEGKIEDEVFARKGDVPLRRRPLHHEWCAARSREGEGSYFFCDWLTDYNCGFCQCAVSVAGCERCETGQGPCANGRNRFSQGDAEAAGEKWSLPLGPAFELKPSELDYELRPLAGEQPAIRGKGLSQTYLIFGGPGAGKTAYFKYMLKSLLKHKDRPGCLVLDPKGTLTPWLRRTLSDIEREEPTVLERGAANVAAFNVLGHDLEPGPLGRLLAEIVLATADEVPEGWSIFVGELLESAAIIIDIAHKINDENPSLTVDTLLQQILYEDWFNSPEGVPEEKYPIEALADYVTASTNDPATARVARRIGQYFSTTKPEQRRFVRQVIEQALGDFMLPEWQYLSGTDSGREDSPYPAIIRRNQVVSVSVGQSNGRFQRALSTLVKAIFQKAARVDLSNRSDPNDKPFFILACDEYALAITEGSEDVSDSFFFSQSRETGCLNLLALQSVSTGRGAIDPRKRDRWDSILGNVTVKFFMKLNDKETADLASDLVGSQRVRVPTLSTQQSAQGSAITDASTIEERPRVPYWYLTSRMETHHALVHGTLDGESEPVAVFVKNPSGPKDW